MATQPTQPPALPKLHRRQAPPPPSRQLRAYAFDPSLNLSMQDWLLNQVVIRVPWEEEDVFGVGPAGEYLEVVDIDPASGLFYPPVNLNDPNLLAQDGLPPDEGNPQFHQQMVYAVAMATISRFERALGRRALWAPGKEGQGDPNGFIRRLRVYPHALREANAYYSPQKKALIFGYFPAQNKDPAHILPGGMVFSCLSHDIVAHETTHALLDGMQRLFIEPSNPDVLAFHEAFADIVALFQHFTYPEVLRSQIARAHGDLANENMLGQLAQQFGLAIGRRGALRDALGSVDEQSGEWKRSVPDPSAYQIQLEPHARGAILVAAVFDAFLAIYKARVADLVRLATGGSGVLPPGDLHPDLINRLADEGAKAAGHVLNICIRALDYLAPVDPTFGDYLRALITADVDMVPDDPHNYRIAFIEGFRRYGIYPRDVRSLSVESLLWSEPDPDLQSALIDTLGTQKMMRGLSPDWVTTSDRKKVYYECLNSRKWLQSFLDQLNLADANHSRALHELWLYAGGEGSRKIAQTEGFPKLEVEFIRPAHRIAPSGDAITDLVISIIQRRNGYRDVQEQARADAGASDQPADFLMYGGCTLLIDLASKRVRYSIGKRIESDRRLNAQRDYLVQRSSTSLHFTYLRDVWSPFFLARQEQVRFEPFALLHGE